MTRLGTGTLVALALVAFAGNSLLARAALDRGHADPATFTLVRLASGAAALFLLARARRVALSPSRRGALARAVALVGYAALFSWAYVRVGTGVGALVLFGCVQLTMLSAAVRAGQGPRGVQWVGVLVALLGLAFLTVPGAAAPDALGVALMAGSGVAWGAYSLLGRTAPSPLAATATSFLFAAPLAAAVAGAAALAGGLSCDATGFALAATSGAVTSGLGYAVWYAVLPSLGTTRAAVLQLAVPVLAALGGVAVLGEAPNARLLAAGAAILVGIALTIVRRSPAAR